MSYQLPSFPLDVVEHIQTFMSYKDATRSASICTRLYQSWYARKHVELDERVFTNSTAFWNVGVRTIRRYQNAHLKLDKFIIRMEYSSERDQFSPSVIAGAAMLGAEEITIVLYDHIVPFRIPHGVFESGDLVTLNVIGGALRLEEEIPVICSSLKFLTVLPAGYIHLDNDLLNNYLLRCPGLQSLKCRGFLIRFNLSSLGTRSHNLNSLCVETLSDIDSFWFTFFIASLPSLRLLVVRNIPECNHLVIRNRSIEMISIEERLCRVDAKLFVPHIQSFHFIGIPSSTFRFKTCLGGVMSSVHVDTNTHVDNWYWELHSLLDNLACSMVHLSVTCTRSESIPWVDPERAFVPVDVEILDVSEVNQGPAMLESLLRVCNPSLVIH